MAQLPWTITWEANGTCVDVTFGTPTLAADTTCTLRAGTESVSSTTGAVSRTEQVCGLTPDEQYAVMVDCGDTLGGAISYDLYTAEEGGGEPPNTTTIPFTFGTPTSYLPSAARVNVCWSAAQAMTSPTCEQDTDFGAGGINVDLPMPDATTSWIQWCWQTAADATLACSKPQQIAVP
jgi:hypothetical protein